MTKEKTTLYFISLVAMVAVVGIVLMHLNGSILISEKDIAGEAVVKATIATKTTTKATTSAKTTVSSIKKAITKKTFCGDKSYIDGTHVSCYKNKKGICECEEGPSKKDIQKYLLGKKSMKIEGLRSISKPKISSKAYVDVCQSGTMYSTGAPIIDAFMMEYEADIDDDTLQDFADYVELAYCNATGGDIVINITAKKYNMTPNWTEYPDEFLEYKPFLEYEEDYESAWEYLEGMRGYSEEQIDEIKNLEYKDFLSEDDYLLFYWYWAYKQKVETDLDYDDLLKSLAEDIGYEESRYDLLISITGLIEESGTNNYCCDPIKIGEPSFILSPSFVNDGYMHKSSSIETGFSILTSTIIHEIGHYMGAAHACNEAWETDTCDECRWAMDVMSYCSFSSGLNIYSSCTLDFLENYYIPNYPDGSNGRDMVDYYDCESIYE